MQLPHKVVCSFAFSAAAMGLLSLYLALVTQVLTGTGELQQKTIPSSKLQAAQSVDTGILGAQAYLCLLESTTNPFQLRNGVSYCLWESWGLAISSSLLCSFIKHW